MPFDQAHEQNNEVVKSTAMVVQLVLLKIPQLLGNGWYQHLNKQKILKEFEDEYVYSDSESDAHHKERFSAQKALKKQTNSLIHVWEILFLMIVMCYSH